MLNLYEHVKTKPLQTQIYKQNRKDKYDVFSILFIQAVFYDRRTKTVRLLYNRRKEGNEDISHLKRTSVPFLLPFG